MIDAQKDSAQPFIAADWTGNQAGYQNPADSCRLFIFWLCLMLHHKYRKLIRTFTYKAIRMTRQKLIMSSMLVSFYQPTFSLCKIIHSKTKFVDKIPNCLDQNSRKVETDLRAHEESSVGFNEVS